MTHLFNSRRRCVPSLGSQARLGQEHTGDLQNEWCTTEKAVTADGWRHTSLQVLPVNPAFEPIEIEPEAAADVVLVGEFSAVVPPG